jgi:hypothetical protein
MRIRAVVNWGRCLAANSHHFRSKNPSKSLKSPIDTLNSTLHDVYKRQCVRQYVRHKLAIALQSDRYGYFINICTYNLSFAIMDVKLTLKLDKSVIDKAKEYASSHKKSLSRMIEAYLKSLIDKDSKNPDNDFEISPFVKSMQTGVKIQADFDFKKAYAEYLMEKYI